MIDAHDPDTLFGWEDFAPPAPDWAAECFYCRPDGTGAYDRELHLGSRLNHLTHALLAGADPDPRDLAALELGWRRIVGPAARGAGEGELTGAFEHRSRSTRSACKRPQYLRPWAARHGVWSGTATPCIVDS